MRADNLAHGRVVQASKWASVCLLLLSGSLINRVRIFNLGWYFFPLKVALDTLFLSSLWTKLAEIWYTSPKFFAKSVHRRQRNLVSDTTFEAKKRQPILKIRTLLIKYASKFQLPKPALRTERGRHGRRDSITFGDIQPQLTSLRTARRVGLFWGLLQWQSTLCYLGIYTFSFSNNLKLHRKYTQRN